MKRDRWAIAAAAGALTIGLAGSAAANVVSGSQSYLGLTSCASAHAALRATLQGRASARCAALTGRASVVGGRYAPGACQVLRAQPTLPPPTPGVTAPTVRGGANRVTVSGAFSWTRCAR